MGGKVLELKIDKLLEHAYQEGFEQGLKQGREEVTTQFIKNMLNHGLSLEKICLYTECSMDKVLQIKENLEKTSLGAVSLIT